MRLPVVFTLSLVTVFGLIAVSRADSESGLFAVYTDKHGTWRVPTEGVPTKIANWLIEKIPRYSMSFVTQDLEFDMDRADYRESCMAYILITGLVGCVFVLVTVLFFFLRYCLGMCGGTVIPRRGYSETKINVVRTLILILAFFLEACLIFGFFANSDLHKSLQILINSYDNAAKNLSAQGTIISNSLPAYVPEEYNLTLFQNDFSYAARYSRTQTDSMKNAMNKYENYRMVVIIANLVLATFACSVGVCAGSVKRGWPVIIMLILTCVSGALSSISLGVHFTGSKLVYEYCTEIREYYEEETTDIIPMRLQYFVSCVNSPLYPFIEQSYLVKTVTAVEDLSASMHDAGLSDFDPISWKNVSNTVYYDLINSVADSGKKTALLAQYSNCTERAKIMQVFEQSETCEYSKQELRDDDFLMCSYAKDNLDMLMFSQFIAVVVLLIFLFIGIPAIKMFEYSGNANLAGVLQANAAKTFGRPAKRRR